jgi:putative ABC transport system ATP-binding protein
MSSTSPPHATRSVPAVHFENVALPGGHLSFEAYPGEIVHLEGGTPTTQLRVFAVASAYVFGGAGRCRIDGLDTLTLDDTQRQTLRSHHIARVMVSDSLMPSLPLLANVAQPALQRGQSAHEALQRASNELDSLGLTEAQSLPPSVLSLAQTRLALVARAIACRPRLLLLERPEIGLGAAEITSLRILLSALATSELVCVLMTTTNPRLAASADRRVALDSEAEAAA